MSSEIHAGNIGTVFRITVKDGDDIVDVSTVLSKLMYFSKPNGEVLTKNASFYTDGVDGVIQYTSASGDLDQVGTWELQSKIIFPNGNTFYTDIQKFKVIRNLL